MHYAPETLKSEVNVYPILREINIGKIWMSKIAFFTISEILNFEFWYIWDLEMTQIYIKSKFRTS